MPAVDAWGEWVLMDPTGVRRAISIAAIAALVSGSLPIGPSPVAALGSSARVAGIPADGTSSDFEVHAREPAPTGQPVSRSPVLPLHAGPRDAVAPPVASSTLEADAGKLPTLAPPAPTTPAPTTPAPTTPAPTTPAPTAPDPPTHVLAAPGDASATVVWTAPADTGGSAITGYAVTASPGGHTCTTTGALSCAVRGLTNGAAYTFTVTAANSAGIGAPSEPSGKVTPVAPVYAISGTVSDSDGPLAGVSVRATAASGACPCYTATTDAEGDYTIRGVTPGSYQIYADDLERAHVNGYYTGAGTAAIDVTQAARVDVTGASATGIDIVLASGFKVSGTITDVHGQARGDIHVLACTSRSCYLPPATSDSDGRYAIVLPPGTYALRILDPNGIFLDGYYAASGFATDRSAASDVVLSTADQPGMDVALNGGLPGYSIAGSVAFGSGVSGVLGEVTALACPTSGGPCLARTSVAADGTYTISELPPDSYLVRFVYRADYDGTVATYDGYYGAAGFTLAQAPATAITLPLDATAVDATLPVSQSIRGRLIGADGQPLAGIHVSAGDRIRGTYQATTAPDGRFAIPVDPGTYILRFDDPNLVYPFGYYGQGGYVRDWSSAEGVTVAAAGTDVGYLALPLGRSISGTLTGTNGEPLVGVTVLASLQYWYGDAQTGVTDSNGRFTIHGLGPATYFLMEEGGESHARGFYSRTSPGNWSARFDYGWVDTAVIPVSAADVGGIAIRVPAGYTLSGAVRNAAGDPIANIAVEASDNGLWPETSTAADGTYRLSSVSAGPHTISFAGDSTYAGGYYVAALADGYSPEPSDATAMSVSSDTGGLDVVLPIGRSIGGTVSAPDGSAAAGEGVHAAARVYACRHAGPDDTDCPFALTGGDGSFELHGLAPGSYVLAIRSVEDSFLSGYYDSTAPGNFTTDLNGATQLVIDSADATGIAVQPSRAHAVSGTIRDSRGQPLAGADVFACSAADMSVCYGTDGSEPTGADGTFTVLHLPAGSYILWVNAPGGYRNGYWGSSGWAMSAADATAIAVPPDATAIDLAMPSAVVPSAPTGVSAVGADRSAAVSWLPAAQSGNVDVIVYTATASDGHSSCATTESGCTVVGLTNGHPYTFTVTAANDIGSGRASAPSGSITPAGVPGAPTKVVAVRGDGSVQVSWKAPDASGSPILAYSVTSSPAGGSCSAAVPKCLVTGLTNGTAYTFTVTATNSVGIGGGSQPSAAVVPSAAASISFSTLAGPVTAGTSSSLRLTVLGTDGRVLAGYTGTVHFTSTDPAALLPDDYTFTWADAGKHDIAITFKTAGSISVGAVDTVTQVGGSESGIAVTPGQAESLALLPIDGPVVAGTPASFTLTVLDAYGNTVTGYTGTVHFTSADPNAVLPDDYTFTQADSGTHTFQVTFGAAGLESLVVADTVTDTIDVTEQVTVVNGRRRRWPGHRGDMVG